MGRVLNMWSEVHTCRCNYHSQTLPPDMYIYVPYSYTRIPPFYSWLQVQKGIVKVAPHAHAPTNLYDCVYLHIQCWAGSRKVLYIFAYAIQCSQLFAWSTKATHKFSCWKWIIQLTWYLYIMRHFLNQSNSKIQLLKMGHPTKLVFVHQETFPQLW